jgi:ABC-type glycerol-3-phosphate transport system substrate-binding protein
MKRFIILLLLIAVLLGGSLAIHHRLTSPGLRGLRIDPDVPVDPEKEYSIMVWECIFPEMDREERVESFMTDFRSKYPNVKVSFKRFTTEEGVAALEDALEMGVPPDIFCGPPIFSPLQIPLAIFLTEDDMADFSSYILNGGIKDGLIWSLPRWISPSFLLGNVKVLKGAGFNMESAVSNGWTWEEFSMLVAVLGERGEHILLPFYDSWLFQELAWNNGLARIMGLDGKFLWDEVRVAETARFAKELHQMKGFHKEPQTLYGKSLELLLTDKVAIYGKGNTHLLMALVERNRHVKGGGPELIPLPLPYNLNNEWWVSAQVFYVSAYISGREKGDDHLKAVAELAKFLTLGDAVGYGIKAGLLPAAKTRRRASIETLNLSPLATESLITLLTHSIAREPDHVEKREKIFMETLSTHTQGLFQGTYSPEDFARRIMEEGANLFSENETSKIPRRQIRAQLRYIQALAQRGGFAK